MEIKQDVVKRLIEVFQKKRDAIVKNGMNGFQVYHTETGKIVTAQLKNTTGWYSLVCFYDCSTPIVDIYDMHVFERYRERFMKGRTDKDVITEFLRRGNGSGILLLKEEDDRFEKKIKDGATMGTMKDGIIYHKTYITDSMIKENKMDYLFDL